MVEPKPKLHVAVFPWLAFGHMIPFLELSKLIARKGHTVSFISTPRNISRLPKLPSDLQQSIKFVALPLPRVEHLPENAEATCDVPETHIVYLKKALDGMSESFSEFLDVSRPDWIVYDFVHHWLPSIAEKFGVSRAFFLIFNASAMCVMAGQPSLIIEGDPRKTAKDLTVSPPWIPLETNVVFRLFEAVKIMEYPTLLIASDLTDTYRLSMASLGSDIIAIKTCTELEPEWVSLLSDLHSKPIVPTGLLPPAPVADPGNKTWLQICKWLDGQPQKMVIYVALGTEVTVTDEEIRVLAQGLELSGLPFIWAFRKEHGVSKVFHDGFEERTKERGLVWTGWAPQTSILNHDSVGAFITHCGWGSAVEGLSFGHPLIMFPCNLDQPLVARLLAGMNVGLEIPRNEQDGSFTSAAVAETIRLVVAEEEGKIYRDTAASLQKKIFGNKTLNDEYADKFIEFLVNHRAGMLNKQPVRS